MRKNISLNLETEDSVSCTNNIFFRPKNLLVTMYIQKKIDISIVAEKKITLTRE